MISVVIPTLNEEKRLAACFSALVSPMVEGLIKEVIVVDGGSSDDTLRIADMAGARVISAPEGRGSQLAAGAKAANGPWLLFLHADTILEEGWSAKATVFMATTERPGGALDKVAAFRFALDDEGLLPRLLERIVSLRSALFALPYGDQALLIHRSFYARIGGYRQEMPLMEDVDLVRRIGWRRMHILPVAARTCAARYRKSGYIPRMTRNFGCLLLYYAGVAPERIARIYE